MREGKDKGMLIYPHALPSALAAVYPALYLLNIAVRSGLARSTS